jgi:hypothetical protein
MFILRGMIIGEYWVFTIFPGGMFIPEGMFIIFSEFFRGVCLFQRVLLFGTSEYHKISHTKQNDIHLHMYSIQVHLLIYFHKTKWQGCQKRLAHRAEQCY